MTRWVSVGRVGKAHGRDGSFYVERPEHPLTEGTLVRLGEVETRIVRRAGTDERPLVRLDAFGAREALAGLHGERLLAPESESPLQEGEWLVEDLVGCEVPGLGAVRQVIDAPSCDVLVVGEDGVLVPLVSDAVRRVDVAARVIEVDLEFLRLGPQP